MTRSAIRETHQGNPPINTRLTLHTTLYKISYLCSFPHLPPSITTSPKRPSNTMGTDADTVSDEHRCCCITSNDTTLVIDCEDPEVAAYEALQFLSTPPPAAFAIWLTNRTYSEAKSLCRVEPVPTVLRRHGYEGVVFRDRALG